MAAGKSNPQPTLRPQDLLVLLRLVLQDGPAPSYAALAAELGLTASETHGAVQRAVAAGLAYIDPEGGPRVVREALRLFVQHGARYCCAPLRGELTRGLPTGYAAAPLEGLIVAPASEPPPVWPDPHGTRRGMTLHPLYPSVPEAARRNPALYELLALFDAVRAGSPRERVLALPLIEERLQS